SPEAITLAKTYGLAVGGSGAHQFVVDVGPFMVWLGVLLAVNMQTSFMHPPFGFALMFLRSVAPAEPYADRVTGKLTEGVTSPQIFWGAVPFVV
ncbi:TRAP transporter large permease subunit, partial [Streptococcus suis]